MNRSASRETTKTRRDTVISLLPGPILALPKPRRDKKKMICIIKYGVVNYGEK